MEQTTQATSPQASNIERFKQDWQLHCPVAHAEVLNLRLATINLFGFHIDVRSPEYVLSLGVQTWILGNIGRADMSRDLQHIFLIEIAEQIMLAMTGAV